MSEPEAPRGRLRSLWVDLRDDPSFRATFFGAIVVPTLCGVAVVAWIVLAVARGR